MPRVKASPMGVAPDPPCHREAAGSLDLSLSFSAIGRQGLNLRGTSPRVAQPMDTPAADDVHVFDGFRLDAGQRLLSRDGRDLPLSPKAVEILLVLVEHRGKVVSKNQLLDAVWKNVVVEESNLYGYLHILRNTLGNDRDGKPYVETLPRRGYRFNGDVRPTPPERRPGESGPGGWGVQPGHGTWGWCLRHSH